jgi:hypothetical protein
MLEIPDLSLTCSGKELILAKGTEIKIPLEALSDSEVSIPTITSFLQ